MLPLAPDEAMPAVEPIASVAPELRVNVPAPLITLVPQSRVTPLLTVAVPATSMLPVSVFVPLPLKVRL